MAQEENTILLGEKSYTGSSWERVFPRQKECVWCVNCGESRAEDHRDLSGRPESRVGVLLSLPGELEISICETT